MSCNGMAFFSANFMFQTPHEEEDHHQPSPSLNPILPSGSPQDFHGLLGSSFLGNKRSMSYTEDGINGGEDEYSDDGSQAGGFLEKKRRLNMEQVKTLEKNFELGNKLEPERKIQLARALGLQPRQIAIWFQNRRARWKTKQLEKDYGILKKQFETMKADNDALHVQNQKLLAEIMAMKGKEPAESINLNKETEGSSSNRSENSCDIKLEILSRTAAGDTSPPLSSYPISGRSLFPSSSSVRPAEGIPQLFANNYMSSSSSSSRPDGHNQNHQQHHHHQNFQCQKIDQMVKEEGGLSNMFCGIDEQSGFWPWLDQQHFN